MPKVTQVVDRKSGKLFEEKIFGEGFVRWAHETSLGIHITSRTFVQKLASRAYGAYANSFFSKKEIKPFIFDHKIQMEDFVEPEGGFDNFNQFFSRKLRNGARPFLQETENDLLCPAEGRVFYSPIQKQKTSLVVKGRSYSVNELLGEETNTDLGHAFVVRLCPVDYHRYHFGFDGKVLEQKKLGLKLYSVNPLALDLRNDVFWENERMIQKLEKTKTKEIIYQAEVGAICVGKMTQTKEPGDCFVCGEEKGTFLFGGSTCLLFLPKNFEPAQDLFENSKKGFETLVRVGQPLGKFF